MTIRVNITDVKRNLTQFINQVRGNNEQVLILRHGKPVAKLIGLAEDLTLKTQPLDSSCQKISAEDSEAVKVQIKNLIVNHTKIEDQNLLLAIWFNKQNPEEDVHLLEIAEGFPDNGLGRLETFTFAPTPNFQIPGRLYLTLTSPTELEDALHRKDPTLQRILQDKNREVIYQTPLGSEILEKLKNGT